MYWWMKEKPRLRPSSGTHLGAETWLSFVTPSRFCVGFGLLLCLGERRQQLLPLIHPHGLP